MKLRLYFADAKHRSELRRLSTNLKSVLLEDLGCTFPSGIELFGERTRNHLSLSRQSGSSSYTLTETFPYKAKSRPVQYDENEYDSYDSESAFDDSEEV